MSRPVNINETLTFNPAAYDSGTFTTNTSYPTSNGLTNTSSTSYARFTVSTTRQYCIYSFNVTGIPSNATITSVSCSVKAYVTSTSTNVTTKTVQLYSGTTAMGSAYTLPTSNSTFTITNPGTWTLAQLANAKIRFTGQRSGTSNSYYIRFYGANLSVTYSIQGTEYEIISTLATDAVDSIDPAGQTYVMEGNDYELTINAADIKDFKVEDNGVDVTSSLIRHNSQAGSYTFTGIPTSFDSTNSVYDTTGGDSGNGIYSTNYIANGLTDHNSSTRCALYSVQGSRSTSYMYYNFDCSSIPANATITSVSCQFKGGSQGSSYYSSYTAQLTTGTTLKGSSTSVTGTNSSPSTVTINGGSFWTRAELNNIKIKFQVVRGSSNTTEGSTWSFFGATLTVNYTVTPENPYYWTYSLSSISADHTIIISDAIIEIPEEDPQYDYYPITISSINATTEPGRRTIRVVEGTNQTITIYPDDPSIALVTDNGVDITNQLVAHGGTIPTPTVATLSGASYGFNLNNNTGYYVSQNAGVDKSAAVCRVTFNLPVRCLVTINYINYAEAQYDFGVFGNIDVALSTNYYAADSGGATITDSNYKLACNTSSMNTSSVQTITYEIPSGEHYIDIKFSKDDATAKNNDTLQWKITNVEALEPNNYYTYTLSNIQEAHSLIFIFGDVTYYFVNSSGTNAKLFPSGSMVQLPGDYYTLVIVPDDYSYDVTVTDNNTNVTSQVQRKEEEITKDGNTYTVVNYIYKLNNIQATHNIVVQCSAANSLYIKINGSWVQATKVYKKISGTWVEQTDYSTVFDPNQIYVSGS